MQEIDAIQKSAPLESKDVTNANRIRQKQENAQAHRVHLADAEQAARELVRSFEQRYPGGIKGERYWATVGRIEWTGVAENNDFIDVMLADIINFIRNYLSQQGWDLNHLRLGIRWQTTHLRLSWATY